MLLVYFWNNRYCILLLLVYFWNNKYWIYFSFFLNRKGKKHSSKKSRDGGGNDRSRSSPAIQEVEEPKEISPSKKKMPVKFYIDDHEDEGEKENLIKAPEIVVDPPSDMSHQSTPELEQDTKV